MRESDWARRTLYKLVHCDHDGYHAIQTAYDHSGGELVYFWTCERCGMRLREARREAYRPAFDPSGNKLPGDRRPLTN